MTQEQAYAKLPEAAYWSCSFGNPGEGGFSEYYRTPDGRKYVISNGKWDEYYLNNWTIEEVSP
jgi:hypothetical protein